MTAVLNDGADSLKLTSSIAQLAEDGIVHDSVADVVTAVVT
jgi:hypothetical protein